MRYLPGYTVKVFSNLLYQQSARKGQVMEEQQPAELLQLQENVAEIFRFVKKQAQLARGNMCRQEKSLVGYLRGIERGVHKRCSGVGATFS